MREVNNGADINCPACKKQFRTYIQGNYGKICPECRGDFGIRNAKEAEEFLTMLDGDAATSIKELTKNRSAGSTTKPAVKLDAAKLQDIARVMIDYGVTAPLPATLPKPTTYAIAKNGLFEVRDSDIARIIIQPKDVLGLSETLTPGVTLHIPRVPYQFLQQTVAFFREVCTKAHGTSEALVQVWWNRVKREYIIHVPEQSVSGGGVNHRSEFDKENERGDDGAATWLHVMDIHSHGTSMSAFWSGTDDGDEKKAPEGRMFGVIGRVALPLPEWRWRMRSREGFIDLKVTDVFDINTAHDVPFTVSWGIILDSITEKDGVSQDGRVRLLCPVDPFHGITCPPEWHEKVKAHSYGGYQGGHYGGIAGFMGGMRHQTTPMYIFIETSDNLLEEFLVDADAREAPKSTGKKVVWKPKETDTNVH